MNKEKKKSSPVRFLTRTIFSGYSTRTVGWTYAVAFPPAGKDRNAGRWLLEIRAAVGAWLRLRPYFFSRTLTGNDSPVYRVLPRTFIYGEMAMKRHKQNVLRNVLLGTSALLLYSLRHRLGELAM
jgi:hypothetical protein